MCAYCLLCDNNPDNLFNATLVIIELFVRRDFPLSLLISDYTKLVGKARNLLKVYGSIVKLKTQRTCSKCLFDMVSISRINFSIFATLVDLLELFLSFILFDDSRHCRTD